MKLNEKQDFITLSNLIIYAHSMYPDYPLQGFKQLIEDLSFLLNNDGKIVVGYLYDIENEKDAREIYKSVLRNAIFNENQYTYHYFRRMHDLHCNQKSESHDATLIYTKKKKNL